MDTAIDGYILSFTFHITRCLLFTYFFLQIITYGARNICKLNSQFIFCDSIHIYWKRPFVDTIVPHTLYINSKYVRLGTQWPSITEEWTTQKRFIYRLLTRHDSLPVWLVADK
jgi:hypothetical protein